MKDGTITIETELSTKQFDKQITKLKSDIERYVRVLESDAKVPVSLRMSEEERRNLEATIEKMKNQLVGLEQQAQKVGDVGSTAGEKTGRGFESGLKSLKRFALGLFSIRSAFSMISRASNAYLSQNETTANKLNAIWIALGNAIGPIIEIIADGVLKLIGYLNVFLNALGFDVDLTKNMNKSTKAVKDTTKAMKELNNEVYSFDEINKQSKDTNVGGLSGGGSSGINDFKMPELNQDVVKFLQDTAKWLRENWELLALIGGVIAGFKVAKWLSGLSSLIGGGTGSGASGLLGLTGVLKGLLALELITITISIIYYGKELAELKKINEEVTKMNKNVAKEGKRVNDQNLQTAKSYEKGSKEVDKYVESLKQQLESSRQTIEAKQKEKDNIQGLDYVWDAFGGTMDKATEIQEANLKTIVDIATNLQELALEGKLTDEQMQTYTDTMEYLNGVQKENGELVEKAKNPLSMMHGMISDNTIQIYEQINALQKNNDKVRTITDNEALLFSGLASSVEYSMKKIDGLVAKPKVEVQTDTRKLSSLLDNLSKMPIIGSTFSNVANAFKRIGLAKGGIVNLPGKGVPLGNIVTGETTGGAEGVIPMNNEESMDLIGQSIARHVVINLTNNTMLDSRVIARERVKIQENQNFITNGRGV